MSSYAAPPPPPPGSPGAPPVGWYADPRAGRKPRPRAWWFAIGGLLIVVGIALGATTLVLTIRSFTDIDATVAADGQARTLDLQAGQKYLVWDHPGQADACTVTDADGTEIGTAGLGSSSYHRSGGSGAWDGDRTFVAPTGGSTTVTCASNGGPIQVGRAPHLGAFAGGILVAILAPLLFGLAGVAVLIVTTVLFVRRPPRSALGV